MSDYCILYETIHNYGYDKNWFLNYFVEVDFIPNPEALSFSDAAVLASGVEDNLQEVVGHITEGVCRPLKVKRTLFFFFFF